MAPYKFDIEAVIESLLNGQFRQAKRQTKYKCRTNPDKLAHRVGSVVAMLCDPDGTNYFPNKVHAYLEMFNGD